MITIYATLSNNQIHYATNPIRIGDRVIGNPPDEVYAEAGYLPVIETEPPEVPEGNYYVSGWEQKGDQIVQIWTLEELPPEPDELTPDEALDIIIGGVEP